jgi:hypothetical protein
MKIKIKIGDKYNVDFDSKIQMNPEQYKRFVALMKSLFNPLEIEEPNEFRGWRMGEQERIQYPHAWTPSEYEVLLNCSSIEEAVNKLGRSGMSIIIQSGVWTSKYYSWCEKINKDVHLWNNVETIKEFLKEQEEGVLKRRKVKSAKNRIEKIDKRTLEIDNELLELKDTSERLQFTSVGKEAIQNIKALQREKELLESEKITLNKFC